MQLSTKARYAVRAMIELAMNYDKGPLQLKEIARRQDISEKYLEQIMLSLRTSGYVYTRKGSRGGYFLSCPPLDISLFEIIQAVEGSLAPVSCVDYPNSCSRVDTCVTRGVWLKLRDVIIEELKSELLGNLAQKQQKLNDRKGEYLHYQI